jgi:hypothetical protein
MSGPEALARQLRFVSRHDRERNRSTGIRDHTVAGECD